MRQRVDVDNHFFFGLCEFSIRIDLVGYISLKRWMKRPIQYVYLYVYLYQKEASRHSKPDRARQPRSHLRRKQRARHFYTKQVRWPSMLSFRLYQRETSSFDQSRKDSLITRHARVLLIHHVFAGGMRHILFHSNPPIRRQSRLGPLQKCNKIIVFDLRGGPLDPYLV